MCDRSWKDESIYAHWCQPLIASNQSRVTSQSKKIDARNQPHACLQNLSYRITSRASIASESKQARNLFPTYQPASKDLG